MYRRLAATIQDGNRAIARLHPAELVLLQERLWNVRLHVPPTGSPPSPATGDPRHRSDLSGLSLPLPPVIAVPNSPNPGPPPPNGATFATAIDNMSKPSTSRATGGGMWDHLIYAYMIGNTRIVEIFQRVAREFLHGEKLGVPSEEGQAWLRNTEELFFRDGPPFIITTVTSRLRPDPMASLRNACYRMFGMDFNHGLDDNSPYPYTRADAANKEFVTTFEELLREVWLGHINRDNSSGARPTDDAKIEELARKLHDMLITRRLFGNLSREELYFVSMMSWFHLTVEGNLPIVRDLRAEAASPEESLFKIAQLVGLPAHGLSRSYFEIAEAISEVLIAIETGALHQPGAARAFYDPAFGNPLPGRMNLIITHWSIVTGHDVKAGKVAVR